MPRLSSSFLLFAAASAAFSATSGAAQPRGEVVQTTAAGGWAVLQRVHGCEISRPGAAPSAAVPTYYRPFRGDTEARITTRGAGLGIMNKRPGALRAGAKSVPVQVTLAVVLDTTISGFDPQQLMLVTLPRAGEQAFRSLLAGATAADIQSGSRTIGTALLPPASAWEEADRCLARVEQALLTATAPPGPGGVLLPRDRPWPQQAPSRCFGPETYPEEAVRAKAQGDTRVAVTVDRFGYPGACRVVQGAGFKALDSLACGQIMKLGRFFPALNKAGVPVTATWENVVRWRTAGD